MNATDVVTDDHRPAEREISRRRRVVSALLSIAVIVAVFAAALPQIAAYRDVWAAVRTLSPYGAAAVAVTAAFNLWSYLPMWIAVLPGLHSRQAFVASNASTAVANTIPGGGALGVGVNYGLYSSWGFSTAAIARAVLVSGVWNNLVKLGLPAIALVFLAFSGDANQALLTAAVIGTAVLVTVIVVLGAALASDRFARWVASLLDRIWLRITTLVRRPRQEPITGSVLRFRDITQSLVSERWVRITATTVLSHASLLLVMVVSLRAVGVDRADVPLAQIVAAFAFGRLLTAIPVTPGGLGVIELGYTASLAIGSDPETRAAIVAGVLLFRAVTFLPPVLIGPLCLLYWRRNQSWRRPAAD